ncbi:hypothetical protein BV898_00039 [Hypsibius exemplaris]|uniref:Peptidase S1 domain-containing protein n=1 Tax=Hypsibius exemplaris TaxID=2072580 RepID=A0A1W0XEM4_HYPEX|nr:hypothetical protein BV898_00039 [Hypsibius exemplaris]
MKALWFLIHYLLWCPSSSLIVPRNPSYELFNYSTTTIHRLTAERAHWNEKNGQTDSIALDTTRKAKPVTSVPYTSTPQQRRTCMILRSQTLGTCVDIGDVNTECWDKEMEEEPRDCLKKLQVCCAETTVKMSLDEMACGTVGSSIRSPRRLRPLTDAVTKDICWMASLSILRTTGERNYMSDAVIFNSSHILFPMEGVMRLRKELTTTAKRVILTIGKPVYELRQSLDFSQARCGQEYSIAMEDVLSNSLLATLVHKGYALLPIHQGRILPDPCTCRVCLPTQDDLFRLTTSSICYVSGFVNTASGKGKKSSTSLDLLVYKTNLISVQMCSKLLEPQRLPSVQMATIVSKLICGISPDVSGYCIGGIGGSLTCTGDYDQQKHFLIGLSVQPVDCYSAPRLFRNIVGCYDSLGEISTTCALPRISLAGRSNCGRPKTNATADLFGLAFQTASGNSQRALNVARRMQMQSTFPVSDNSMGRSESEFGNSEISNPGLHSVHNSMGLDICWAVAIFNPSKGHCSGVLMSARHILTAAHCATEHDGTVVKDISPLRAFIGFDSIPRETQRNCERIVKIKRLTVHQLYSKPSGNRFFDLNDMALVELDEPIDLQNNPCTCTICLDNIREPNPGELCTLSGFGCPVPIFADEACPAPRPFALSWTNVVILGPKTCSAIPQYPAGAMTCTVTDGGPSGCYGDSGGPLVCFNAETSSHYLHGIFSFILSTSGNSPQRCRTQPLTPNFYTKVNNYLPWLIENLPGLEMTL